MSTSWEGNSISCPSPLRTVRWAFVRQSNFCRLVRILGVIRTFGCHSYLVAIFWATMQAFGQCFLSVLTSGSVMESWFCGGLVRPADTIISCHITSYHSISYQRKFCIIKACHVISSPAIQYHVVSHCIIKVDCATSQWRHHGFPRRAPSVPPRGLRFGTTSIKPSPKAPIRSR